MFVAYETRVYIYAYIRIYVYTYILIYGVGLLAGGRMGPEGENHPLTTRRVRAEYADLHTHIISSTYKPAKSASKPASPQASKSAKCKQASQPQQASQPTHDLQYHEERNGCVYIQVPQII